MTRAVSPQMLKAMFSPEADDTLVVLMTITTSQGTVRLADNFTMRLSETDTDIVYGLKSRGQDYIFLPLEITLPSEEHNAAPRCSVTIHDVTQYIVPIIRQISTAPTVKLELVLKSNPDVVEIEFPGLLMGAITYDAHSVQAELTVESLTVEPFPAHSMTPSSFPGLF